MEQNSMFRNLMAGVAFLLNTISACYIIIFAFLQDGAPLQTLFGLLILAALLMNIFLAYVNIGRGVSSRVQKWGSAYLVVSIIAMLIMPAAGFAASSVYDRPTAVVLTLVAVYIPFLAVFLIGAYHSWQTRGSTAAVRELSSEGTNTNHAEIILTGRKKLLIIVLTFFLFPGFFTAFILLSRYPGLLQVVVSPCALFFAFVFPALAILILKLYGSPRRPFGLTITSIGFILMGIFMLPLFAVPSTLRHIEEDFSSTFGENWQEQIPPVISSQLRKTRFSLPGYFLGYFPGNYNYRKDILFYEGSEGAEEELKLYFDHFSPLSGDGNLPGDGSTIIRIHGGAWVVGDKGPPNMLQMNKYLASLGYTVFDIQYGLTENVDFLPLTELYNCIDKAAGILPGESASLSLGAPEHLRGPYTLDDMMNHLGIFTDYLAENADELEASTESVFISGGSAGGHLSTALALAISGGDHDHLFNPDLQVSGYIPFYPANRATSFLEMIGGAEEWINVESLVRPDSPPCLIFQGTNDGLVPMETAKHFKERYAEAGNDSCVVIYMPYAAHAADYLFGGYYNQIFLYYMERFMALHR